MQTPGTGEGIVVVTPPIGDGRLADNIVYFARVLRRAGLKPGPGAVADAALPADLALAPCRSAGDDAGGHAYRR